MFAKIQELGNQVQVNKSEVKSIKKDLTKKLPEWEPYIETFIPKKCTIYNMRLKNNGKSDLIIKEGEVLFFKHKKLILPTLRMLHMYPHTMKKLTVDKGAIKFVLSGAHIMCPGLTSPGGILPDCEVGEIVAIMAEGKQHALAIGITTMSSSEIREINKDIAVEILHFVSDDLWNIKLP